MKTETRDAVRHLLIELLKRGAPLKNESCTPLEARLGFAAILGAVAAKCPEISVGGFSAVMRFICDADDWEITDIIEESS